MLSRRRLLTVGGAGLGALLVSSCSGAAADPVGGGHHGHGSGPSLAPVEPGTTGRPFAVRMPVPPEAQLVQGGPPGHDTFRVTAQPTRLELVPGALSSTLTYDGLFVGPTIRARQGIPVALLLDNRMDAATNVHLHGSVNAPEHDGQPFDLVEPGGVRDYRYENLQPAQTMWYHDHNHHVVAEHVYRGLHGFYLLGDEAEDALGLPSGAQDVPIMLTEASFDATGVLRYEFTDFNRPTTLVNGAPRPYFPVEARRYRLRLLNASNHGVLHLDLGGAPMVQVTSDQGLLPAPVQLTELVLGPAERADVVVDFGVHQPGTQVLMSAHNGPVLRFDVGPATSPDTSAVPAVLVPMTMPAMPTTTRDIELRTDFTTISSLINGRTHDDARTDFTPVLGSTEIWRIVNNDVDFGGVDHTFHLHHARFRILDRDDGAGPYPYETGWKDTVLIRAGRSVRIAVTFADRHPGRFVCHCHMLEHAQAGMMANLEIQPPPPV